MTQLQKALPCPFCGSSEGLDYHDGSTHRWGVASCVSCGASAGETRREYPDVGEWHYAAMKQWNTRSALAQQSVQQPRAWISSYVDSANNHGVVLGESREEVIARCEDCMGNQLESYSEPEPLYTARPAPVEQRCTYCDGTGDVHSIDGEWRGTCHCAAAPAPQPAQGVGRTNPGDETGGAVERFGWQTFLGKSPEIIPATNGSFVWYSDYLKLWQSAQPKQEPLTDEQIEQAVKTNGVSWAGYREDSHGFYTIPILFPYHYQFARAIEAAHGINGMVEAATRPAIDAAIKQGGQHE